MLNYGQGFYELKKALQPLYDEGEADAIAHMIMENLTGLGKLQRLDHKETPFTEAQQTAFDTAKNKLLSATPVQYVLGKAWFWSYEFTVNEDVLIPRPETEELVEWLVRGVKKEQTKPNILDIGTGSGCISITTKLQLPEVTITACDVSEGALAIAQQNAKDLAADVTFMQVDFLKEEDRNKLGTYDIIVSNPPYIPVTEQHTLHANVLDHEPHVALFVPGNDPLLFYRLIADFGKERLTANGLVYCELDADHAMATKELFESKGYSVEIREDLAGNTRMLKASL